ncbi:hypothetical protein P7C73_g1548, partial [Tremellales sp. Uapishka_1]
MLFLLAALLPALSVSALHLGSVVRPRASVEYDNPLDAGGYMLTIVNGTYPAGLGEPLNVILSAESDAAVLQQTTADGGFLNFMLSAQLGQECLGQHLGDDQMANLGDGHGNTTEAEELRWDFGNPYIGTCEETFNGGLHLRYWVQNNTGAYFMAVSVEKDLTSGHDIVLNGYNAGRDYLVGNITNQVIPSETLTNQSTFTGSSTFDNYTYSTSVKYVSGLLQNSSDGVNHYLSVAENGKPAIDGLVAVLTVTITATPPKTAAAQSTLSHLPPILLVIPTLVIGLVSLL